MVEVPAQSTPLRGTREAGAQTPDEDSGDQEARKELAAAYAKIDDLEHRVGLEKRATEEAAKRCNLATESLCAARGEIALLEDGSRRLADEVAGRRRQVWEAQRRSKDDYDEVRHLRQALREEGGQLQGKRRVDSPAEMVPPAPRRPYSETVSHDSQVVVDFKINSLEARLKDALDYNTSADAEIARLRVELRVAKEETDSVSSALKGEQRRNGDLQKALENARFKFWGGMVSIQQRRACETVAEALTLSCRLGRAYYASAIRKKGMSPEEFDLDLDGCHDKLADITTKCFTAIRSAISEYAESGAVRDAEEGGAPGEPSSVRIDLVEESE